MVVLVLHASMNLKVEQFDMKITFLHGDLDETIYMEQPKGFEVKGNKHIVCQLKKNLFDLK